MSYILIFYCRKKEERLRIKKLLADRPYIVCFFKNSKEALTYIKDNDFDLFLYFQENSAKAEKFVQSFCQYTSLPLVICSNTIPRREISKMGFDDCFRSYTDNELLLRIERFLIHIKPKTGFYQQGEYHLDSTKKILYFQCKTLTLTSKESHLLELFFKASEMQILQKDHPGFTNKFVYKLNIKLKALTGCKVIYTVYKTGWILCLP